MKNNKSIYVVCSKKSGIPVDDCGVMVTYTSKREALYIGVIGEKIIIEYIPKRRI